MGGTGIELRMRILRDAADQQLLKPFRTHGWVAEVSSENESGEYLIITATKVAVTRKVALMYTSATDNRYYKMLDSTVDYIFTNGALYHVESFTQGITTPVTPVDDFFPLLVAWNKELAPQTHETPRPPRIRSVRQITAENPLEGIWARLNQFSSVQLAEKLVARRASDESVPLTPDTVKTKSIGVAFALQNASEYFRGVPSESLNKRVLSLYYGALALASAEMLASPTGPIDLDEVEGMTKHGHGLYAVSSATEDFGGLNIGVYAKGFFSQWVSFLGHEVSCFPKKEKAKTPSDLEKFAPETYTTIRDLLSALPELNDLFLEVFDTAPSWVTTIYDMEANSGRRGSNESSYIRLVDSSGRMKQERFQATSLAIAEITPAIKDENSQVFRARVAQAYVRKW